MKFLRSKIFMRCYGAFLLLFTVYVLLDTFLIPRSYAVAEDTMTALSGSEQDDSALAKVQAAANRAETKRSAENAAAAETSAAGTVKKTAGTGTGDSENGSTESAANGETVSAADSYTGNGVSITMKTYREENTDIYVADITLSSANLLKTAFANNTYGKNVTEKTSAMAEEHQAVLAVNGDYYGAQNAGYVIRNGKLYREKSSGADTEDLVVWSDGTMEVIREGDCTAQQLLERGALQVFSFGPGLIENGEVSVNENTEVDRAMASNPRTAVGMIDALHYVFVVADGRTSASSGLKVKQLADFMKNTLGCTTAYNLDGGGSSTMYFNGKVVNNPTTNGKISERSVSDIVYIGKSE